VPDEEFRKAVAGVHPLVEPRRVDLKPPAPQPVPSQRRRDEQEALAESLAGPLTVEDALGSGEELVYVREGLSRQVLRKLRRGHWVIQDAVDLHGMTRIEAALCVSTFLGDCARRGLRCVRIVHGRGLGSKNREPVLKNLLQKWLQHRDEVLAYCQAPAAHGGSGATLVLLKNLR
jgi:DNA-nicking Smr family endonuclease